MTPVPVSPAFWRGIALGLPLSVVLWAAIGAVVWELLK